MFMKYYNSLFVSNGNVYRVIGGHYSLIYCESTGQLHVNFRGTDEIDLNPMDYILVFSDSNVSIMEGDIRCEIKVLYNYEPGNCNNTKII